jgi:hypothetical protein
MKLRKRRADSNLVDLGRYAVRARREHPVGDSEAGLNKSVGRPWGMSAAYSWRSGRGIAGHLTRQTVRGERGNHPRSPALRSSQDAGGQARRRLMVVGWGGGVGATRGRTL